MCLVLLAVAAHAEWTRYVFGQLDAPPAHSLAYFRRKPCLRDEKDAVRVWWCRGAPAPAELVEPPSEMYTKLKVAGTIGTFKVYDLEYFFDGPEDPDNPTTPGMRSVLVRTAPNQFHEIHVEDNTGGEFYPTQITKSGQYSILSIVHGDGGIYRSYTQQCFAISLTGSSLLDFAPVLEAAHSVVPDDMAAYQPMSRINFSSRVFHIWTERTDTGVGAKVSCCQGLVEVPFTIRMGRVIPGKAKYSPDVRPQ